MTTNFTITIVYLILFAMAITIEAEGEGIAGTELQTRAYYKLGLKQFPDGIVTWTEEGKSNRNHVQIDNDPTHQNNYMRGQEWYKDVLWQFIPVDNCGVSTGWYALRNAGRPEALWTWFGEYQENKRYIVVDKRYQNRSEDILLKPVKVVIGKQVYYQLKMKNKMEGVVTWTEEKHEDQGSHYLQLDFSGTTNYAKGGKWFDDTLFTAEFQKQSLEDSGHIDVGHDCREFNVGSSM